MTQTGTLSQPYTYTGREWDKETGLYYYRARYYDPMVGRFISKDPIGFAGGDVNLYGYVQNNPVNWIDPFGLDVWVYDYRAAGSGYGHVGLIMPNDNGTYIRYSQGADNPNAPPWQLIIPLHKAVVTTKNLPDLNMPGAEIVMLPTKHNSQIQEAIDAYIRADWPYNVVTNNCADFVNDSLNAADDLNLFDRTIPNSYFDMILKKYGPYKIKKK
jgi:RHS repeat-associated protein